MCTKRLKNEVPIDAKSKSYHQFGQVKLPRLPAFRTSPDNFCPSRTWHHETFRFHIGCEISLQYYFSFVCTTSSTWRRRRQWKDSIEKICLSDRVESTQDIGISIIPTSEDISQWRPFAIHPHSLVLQLASHAILTQFNPVSIPCLMASLCYLMSIDAVCSIAGPKRGFPLALNKYKFAKVVDPIVLIDLPTEDGCQPGMA